MTLRFASLRDDAAVAAIYAPIVTSTAISFELVPPDGAEMRARIARQPADMPWIVAELDGAVAGYAYAYTFRGRLAELGMPQRDPRALDELEPGEVRAALALNQAP